MGDPLDDYLTSDPNDRIEWCEQHKTQPRPCLICIHEYCEAQAQAKREEQQP